ncbi:GNAT family N-acetyltransferase [uncultured Tateyamaria sp.]|uniref:GNAT family N-acetyltransferase n=1 Tax=uncultured Tateyamaria sp. TaxID=455651 RepID=UPI00260FA2E4|nr:GNAT family N-acetyltransferase [uncultured Tateyamaria sp.]
MTVRPLGVEDTQDALRLYSHLAGDQALADGTAFATLTSHSGTTVLGAFDGDVLTAMVTLHILPNMTHGGRPYALIENVVTHADHRGRGRGRQVMQAAIDAAWVAECYKIMLLTGRTANARGFYEKLGFGADEKWGMTLRRVPRR